MPEATTIDRVNIYLENQTAFNSHNEIQNTSILHGTSPSTRPNAYRSSLPLRNGNDNRNPAPKTRKHQPPLCKSTTTPPTPQSNTPRAQHPLSDLLIELPYPYGSPSSSNANAEPISSLPPGYSPTPSKKPSNTKQKPNPRHSRLLLRIHMISAFCLRERILCHRLFCLLRRLMRHRIIFRIIGLSWARYCWRRVRMICRIRDV
jgi:hypothetical protein